MFSKALILGALAATAIAQQTTLNLFVDGDDSEKLVGSVVSADCDATTLALRCTKGEFGSGILSSTCDPSAIISATYGPNSYEVSTATTTDGTAVTLIETCSISSNTAAICSVSYHISVPGTQTQSSTTTTLTSINHFQIPITGGANKLPATATCTANANAAAPTDVTDVYKVLVVPAAILAGAMV